MGKGTDITNMYGKYYSTVRSFIDSLILYICNVIFVHFVK